MDRGFIVLLFLVSLTGLALLICRDTDAMALLLAAHLAAVTAFFLRMPYGKRYVLLRLACAVLSSLGVSTYSELSASVRTAKSMNARARAGCELRLPK